VHFFCTSLGFHRKHPWVFKDVIEIICSIGHIRSKENNMFRKIIVCIPAVLFAVCSLAYADRIHHKISFAQSGEIVPVEQVILRQCRNINQIKYDVNMWRDTFGQYMVQTQEDMMVLEVSINESPGVNCTI